MQLLLGKRRECCECERKKKEGMKEESEKSIISTIILFIHIMPYFNIGI